MVPEAKPPFASWLSAGGGALSELRYPANNYPVNPTLVLTAGVACPRCGGIDQLNLVEATGCKRENIDEDLQFTICRDIRHR